MTPSNRRDALVERLVVLKSELFVCALTLDEPITRWTLDEIGHHVTRLEALVSRLHGNEPELEKSAF